MRTVVDVLVFGMLGLFGLAVLLSMSNGSFDRGWQRGLQRMEDEAGR